MRVYVTGSAGFIGYHLARRLLDEGHAVTGFDGFSDYYDVGLKRARHADLAQRPHFTAVEARLETPGALLEVLGRARPEVVVHLAAQAGVRHSLENPGAYVEANLVGMGNLIEAVRAQIGPYYATALMEDGFSQAEAVKIVGNAIHAHTELAFAFNASLVYVKPMKEDYHSPRHVIEAMGSHAQHMCKEPMGATRRG